MIEKITMEKLKVVALILLGGLTEANASTFYTAEELVTPYDWTYITPSAINDNGEIVGTGSPHRDAFDARIASALYWPTPNSIQIMSRYKDKYSNYSAAYDINNTGMIVGEIQSTETGEYVAVRWDHGNFIEAFGMESANGASTVSARATSINDQDVIVGDVTLSNGLSRAFMYNRFGGFNFGEFLTDPENHIFSTSINNNNIAVGELGNSGFSYNPSAKNRLNVYANGGYYSIADINDQNAMVTQQQNLCVLKHNQQIPLSDNNTSCTPKALNNNQVVVGTTNQFDTKSYLYHAFVYDPYANNSCETGMRDLNAITVTNSDEVVLTEAVDINESGQIIATGVVNGETRAFLLHPSTDNQAIPLSLDADQDGILDNCDPEVTPNNVAAWLVPVLYLLL
ncbi:DUF3466 family protein [Gynuella sunshinyii]|uniref:Putative integral membrane protein containing uncharacterized repeats n=1 Tax=Gynuella sunshinyii YC6258 TaxID=1445510 RepID=A0A0C5W001_9GAMM|nr:DUF3466 family protein [Gynuella sunshinyii]AJQ96009.1 putative integral membrane protein containing uncharacterized repeats [Gynuella sunshinyii YC6258]